MIIARFQRRCQKLLVVAVLLTPAVFNHRGAPAADSESGVIEGVVTYQADPKRPWRYSRYYVKNAKTGELAEAVVAIRSRKLKGAGKSRKPQTATIDQENFQFVPETVAIRAGDSVTFTNSDSSIHNVRTSGRLASFNVTVASGGSHTVLCKHAGNLRHPMRIGCVFHSSMQAWIYVFDHPYFQLTKTDGRFRLEGVPPGKYDLRMTHPAGELQWSQEVAVKAGETLRVDIAVSPDDKD